MTDEPDQDHDRSRDEGAERRVYSPQDESTTLSETVLAAVAAHKDIDVARSDFVLFDAVDPDALDSLFQAEADADMVVEFTVDDARVTLLGDGGVDVRVSDPEGR